MKPKRSKKTAHKPKKPVIVSLRLTTLVVFLGSAALLSGIAGAVLSQKIAPHNQAEKVPPFTPPAAQPSAPQVERSAPAVPVAAAPPARPAAERRTAAPARTPPPERAPVVPPPAQPALRYPDSGRGGNIVFMIDDAGNNLRELEPFLNFPGLLTIAVLPGLPNSAEAARRIRAAGKELFLHQPMESIGGEDPGPGAIYTGMQREEIRRILEKNLAEVGPVTGINNHQGSKASADETVMSIVLEFCKEKGIIFLDSRTTAKTAVPAVAAKLGIPIAARDIFLDNNPEKAAILNAVNDGLAKSERQENVIMIGHAWSKELAATLGEIVPSLNAHKYTLISVQSLLSSSL